MDNMVLSHFTNLQKNTLCYISIDLPMVSDPMFSVTLTEDRRKETQGLGTERSKEGGENPAKAG